jgi:hypothetical protein
MASDEEVRLIIKAATEQAVSNLQKLNDKMEETNKRSTGMSGALSTLKSHWISTTAILGGAAMAFYKVAQAGMESEQVELKLAAAMKNSGTYTKQNYEHLKNYASTIEKTLGIEDEQVMKVQTLLTQYHLEGQALDDLTKGIMDYSTAKGVDLVTAADMMGRAINGSTDSVKGMKVELKDMTSRSERASAVVKELSANFGGDATAAFKSAEGQLKAAKIAVGNIAEAIGTFLLPAIQTISSAVRTAANWFNELGDSAKSVVTGAIVAGVAIAVLTKIVISFGIALSAAIWPITLIVAAIAGVILAIKNWDEIMKYVGKGWDIVVNAAAYAWQYIQIVFLQMAADATKAAAQLVQPFIWAFNKMIEGYNYVTGSHKEMIDNIISQGAEKLQKKIEQEQAELDAIKIFREEDMANRIENGITIDDWEQQRIITSDKVKQDQLEKEEDDLNTSLAKKYRAAGKYTQRLMALDTDYLKFKLKGYGFDADNYSTYQSFIMSNADKSSKWQFRMWQAMSIQETIVNTYKAAVAAFGAMAGIPYVGPALGAAAAIAAVAMGMGMVAKIASTKPGNAEEGGFVRGGPGNGALTYVGEHNKSEAIIPLDDPEAQEKMGGLGQRVTVNFQVEYLVGDSALPDKVAREVDKALYKLKQQNMSRAFA